MTPVKIFGMVIRVIGVILLIYSLWFLTYAVAIILGYPEKQQGYGLGYLLSGIVFLLLSLYFLRGAPHIVKFSYPDEKKEEIKK